MGFLSKAPEAGLVTRLADAPRGTSDAFVIITGASAVLAFGSARTVNATSASRLMHGPPQRPTAQSPLRIAAPFSERSSALGHRGTSSSQFVDRLLKRSYYAWATTTARLANGPRSSSQRTSRRYDSGRQVRRSATSARATARASSGTRKVRTRVDGRSGRPLHS